MPQPLISDSDQDPTLRLAERQLALLGELSEMAMATARAFTASAIASAKAEESILSEEWFTPEVGRARACGARAAAESFQKVSRAVRLTLILEMNLAEIVRDIRLGQVTYIGGLAVRKDAGGTPADPGELLVRRRPAGSLLDDCDAAPRPGDSNAEHLIDLERPDTLLRAPFRDTVDHICGDLGVRVDWTTWRLDASEQAREPLRPPPTTSDIVAKSPARSLPVPARPSG